MDRRNFLKTGAGIAGASLAAPYVARAQTPLTLRWAHFAPEDHPAHTAAKRRGQFLENEVLLAIVDGFDSFDDLESRTALVGCFRQGFDVLGKARPAVTRSGKQETRADPRIAADRLGYRDHGVLIRPEPADLGPRAAVKVGSRRHASRGGCCRHQAASWKTSARVRR